MTDGRVSQTGEKVRIESEGEYPQRLKPAILISIMDGLKAVPCKKLVFRRLFSRTGAKRTSAAKAVKSGSYLRRG
jgi:hypothetical protein